MKQKNMTEMERNNKIAMVAHGIDVGVMITFCLLQVLGGMQKPIYAIIVAILGLAPIFVERFLWHKDKEHGWIKHCIAIGFLIFYTYCIFTGINNMVFLFAIPMILVVSVYNDVKYSVILNIVIIIESIILVAVGASTGKLGYAGSDSAIIQIVIVILIGIYSYLTSKTLNANNSQKINNIKMAQQKTERVLKNVSEMSGNMQKGIEDIHMELEKLNKASGLTKEAMEQVSVGTTDTAEAVQSQIYQTEEIQNKVTKVNDAALHITENMQQTLKALENGKEDMELLAGQVDTSVKNGAEVAEKLTTLDKYMEEMNSIVELIKGITSQTSLLALNASIEAARAGEAGRGFSVVATEITAMATQTQNATVHITELISNVSTAINEVVEVIQQMIEGINKEKQSAEDTSESFENIQSNTLSIQENIENLAHNIEELKDANHVIVNSIQKISGISEKVSKHASETMEAEEENTEILGKIAERMQDLVELTNNKED